MAAHVVVVALIYRLTWLASRSRLIATGTALVGLAMGAGWGTLTWAGQLQIVGSVAAGLAAILLSVEDRGRAQLPLVVAVAVIGTLNGSSFVAFALAGAVVFAGRRLWTPAAILALTPICWQVVVKLVWDPENEFAADSLREILLSGPSFAFAVLDTAVSETLGTRGLTGAVLVGLVVGCLATLSSRPVDAITPTTTWIVQGLGVAVALSLLILAIGRLDRGAALSAGGQYSYIFLAGMLPLIGIVLGRFVRSTGGATLIAMLFLGVTLVGLADLSRAEGLSVWKLGGARLTETAAALLSSNLETYPDQIPVPETAPGLDQRDIRRLSLDGRLAAVVAGRQEADQVSLNVQWRIVPAAAATGGCRNLDVGDFIRVAPGTGAVIRRTAPGTVFDLGYATSSASRRFVLPASPVALRSLSGREATLELVGGASRVCMQR